jgi:hypothetical protein
MDVRTQVLLGEGYRSTEEVFRGWALMTAMSKLEQYRAECELFEKKHGGTLADFERTTHLMMGQEDFNREDDLADWEFATQALEWWHSKAEELRIMKHGYCLTASIRRIGRPVVAP